MKQLYTIWGEQLDPEHVLPEYPRPQMVRNNYLSLNGRWECCWSDRKSYDEDRFPEKFGDVILVPFSPESALSGVGRQTKPDETLWYHRKVVLSVPEGQRVLLHFGAVDQSCRLFVNNFRLLEHVGGYLPFTADITKALVKDTENGSLIADIVLAVRDLSDTSYHARGKQKLERGGMFYTAVSGIWQSVWIEYVPEKYISGLKIVPDADAGKFLITVKSEADLPVEIRKISDYGEIGSGSSCGDTDGGCTGGSGLRASPRRCRLRANLCGYGGRSSLRAGPHGGAPGLSTGGGPRRRIPCGRPHELPDYRGDSAGAAKTLELRGSVFVLF